MHRKLPSRSDAVVTELPSLTFNVWKRKSGLLSSLLPVSAVWSRPLCNFRSSGRSQVFSPRRRQDQGQNRRRADGESGEAVLSPTRFLASCMTAYRKPEDNPAVVHTYHDGHDCLQRHTSLGRRSSAMSSKHRGGILVVTSCST